MAMAESLPPDASTANTGLGFHYIEDWVYAYSGGYPCTTSAQIVLEATTGDGIIVGEFQFNGAVKDAAAAEGNISACTIKLNGIVVSLLKVDTEDSYNGLTTATQKIILPPFTLVQCSVRSSDFGAERLTSVTLTGRVYGVA